MGICSSRPDVVEGAIIVDSVVISNSKAIIKGDLIDIPIKSLRSGETSVMTINRKEGVISISRGPIHGSLSHDMVVGEALGE